MVRCKISTFSVLLAVLMHSTLNSADEFSEYCASTMQEGTKCSDTRHLIECVHRYGIWYAIPLADCGDNLCCDATLPGCRINCAPKPSTSAPATTATPATTTSTSTTAPAEKCNRGDLKPVDYDCTRYMYCEGGVWTEGKCMLGIYSHAFESCIMGSC